MHWIRRFFGPHIVAMSEPYSDGEIWLYILGDEKKFKLRKFKTAEDAYSSYTATLTGLRLGSPEISIKLIKLNTEQARAIARAEASYREIIESHL